MTQNPPRAITITGTRSTGHRAVSDYAQIFCAYLAPFTDETAHFYIGGALGIDSLSLAWLASVTTARLTVVVPGTVSGQPPGAQQAIEAARESGRLSEAIELQHPLHPSAEAYHHRNRWMVDRSDFVIAFPHDNDQTRGTWITANYAAEQGKPRLIVPI